MDADGEHQEDDSNFGHDFEGVNIVDAGTWGQWAQNQAGEDVAQEYGLAEAPGEEPADKGSSEDHGDVAIDERVFGHVCARRWL